MKVSDASPNLLKLEFPVVVSQSRSNRAIVYTQSPEAWLNPVRLALARWIPWSARVPLDPLVRLESNPCRSTPGSDNERASGGQSLFAILETLADFRHGVRAVVLIFDIRMDVVLPVANQPEHL